jgi:hypothetical protein
VVAIEVQVLLSGVFQRVSSDSLASCRSVRSVKQTLIRGATRECTGRGDRARRTRAQQALAILHGQMKGYEVRDGIRDMPK